MTAASPSSLEEHDHHLKKKRVGKACDPCRIKKSKCDGKKPCNRCILDNKICVFTEKKKTRNRSHSNGYVELLETRLDLLTTSLEKMIQLSRPYLPFLSELNDGGKDEDKAVPINRVVQHLINHEGLLHKVPVGWEKGALIAANLGTDSKNIQLGARLDEQKIDVVEKPEPRIIKEEKNDIQLAANNASAASHIQDDVKSNEPLNFSDLETSDDNYPPSASHADRSNPDDFSLGEYSSNVLFDNPYSDIFSDFESDINSARYAHSMSSANDVVNANENGSLLGSSTNSITSLANEFENYGIHSPTCIGVLRSNTQSSSALGRSCSLREHQKQCSLSHRKLKNNGHVNKPNPSHGSSSHNHQAFVSNKGNEFHLQKKISSTNSNSSSAVTPIPNTISPVSIKLEVVSTLPSDLFQLPNINYQGLNSMDTDNIDSFMINNPFL